MTEPIPDYMTDNTEWTIDKLANVVMVDVIHMRYEWLYAFGNIGITIDEIEKHVDLLNATEGEATNDE